MTSPSTDEVYRTCATDPETVLGAGSRVFDVYLCCFCFSVVGTSAFNGRLLNLHPSWMYNVAGEFEWNALPRLPAALKTRAHIAWPGPSLSGLMDIDRPTNPMPAGPKTTTQVPNLVHFCYLACIC